MKRSSFPIIESFFVCKKCNQKQIASNDSFNFFVIKHMHECGGQYIFVEKSDRDSKYLTEFIDKCYNHIESFVKNNVIDHEKQTITYKGDGNITYKNQKLLIAICGLLVAQRDLKKDNFNG